MHLTVKPRRSFFDQEQPKTRHLLSSAVEINSPGSQSESITTLLSTLPPSVITNYSHQLREYLVSNTPLMINGKYKSDDWQSHESYGEAYAANVQLKENAREIARENARRLSKPRKSFSDILPDSDEMSLLTLALGLIWLIALGVLAYKQHWWYFAGTVVVFVPITILEIFIQKLPKIVRLICLYLTILTAISATVYFV